MQKNKEISIKRKSYVFYDVVFMIPVIREWGYMCQGLSAAAVVVSMKAAET